MKILLLIFISIIGILSFYFFNDSYRLSLESKFYFEEGNYDKAYELASEAYKLKPYNNMALTVMNQSKIAKQWEEYIKDADEYFEYISKISNKDYISDAEKSKIKLMLEILIERYPFLTDSKLLDENLSTNVNNRYLKAKQIYEKVFRTRSN